MRLTAAIGLLILSTAAASAQGYPPPYGTQAPQGPARGQGSDRIGQPAAPAQGASPFAPPGGQPRPPQMQPPGQGGTGQVAPPPGFAPPPAQGGQGQPEQVRLPPGVDQQRLQQLAQKEREDFGVAPIADLRRGGAHAPTPTTIPGAKLIDTLGLVSLMSHQPPVPVVIIDALGGMRRLPGAMPGAWAAGGESFEDDIQKQLGEMLQYGTGGNRTTPIVIYCWDPHCWMSYNVALRASRLGYQNVLWYRGGLWAWAGIGMPVQPVWQR